MSTVSGGYLFGQALAKEGIEKAFVLCGNSVMPVFYGMRAVGIEIIDVRHECAGVYAAMAYARATGKPAVVVTTSGPGVLNAIPGIAEAMEAGVPVLHIGGAVDANARDSGPLQDMPTLNNMEAHTKWARKITSTARIPEYVSMALRQAMGATPGPVYLEVPKDLALAEMEESEVVFPTKPRTTALPFGDPALIDKAAELLANAERPALVIDDVARFSIGDHATDIAALSDHLKMPLTVTGSACRGLFGDELANPLLRRSYDGLQFAAQADVVVTMGCKFDWRISQGRMMPRTGKVIQVHTDVGRIGYNVPADIGIVAGAGPVGSQLLAAVREKKPEATASSWATVAPNTVAALPEAYHTEGIPIHPARCAGEAMRFIEEEARDWNIVIDGGDAIVWSSQAARVTRPGQLHGDSNASGVIGAGSGHALGAWVASRKPVLWYTGDGSFGFFPMELETMARVGVPVVCVISNDSAWGMIKSMQAKAAPAEIEANGQCATELSNMRAYEKMAAIWGGHGEIVTDPAEIVPAIRRAAATGKPSIINVEVDKTVSLVF